MIFVEFIQNISEKMHKTFSLKISGLYAISHKTLWSKKGKEMVTSAAHAHILKRERFMQIHIYALRI